MDLFRQHQGGGFPPERRVLLWICLIWSLSRVNLDKHSGSGRVVFSSDVSPVPDFQLKNLLQQEMPPETSFIIFPYKSQMFHMGNQDASPSAAGELPSCLASVDTLVLTSNLKGKNGRSTWLTFTLGSCRSQKRQKINKSYTCHHLKNSFQQDGCPLSNLHHTSSDKAANLVSIHSLTPTC